MRIGNRTSTSSTNSTTSSTARSDNAAGSAAPHLGSPSFSPAASAQDSSMAPSFELQTLTALLAEVPPVRQAVLAETIRRLTSGQLQTSSALEETARALLGE